MGGTFTQKITRISSFDDALFAETSTRMGGLWNIGSLTTRAILLRGSP